MAKNASESRSTFSLFHILDKAHARTASTKNPAMEAPAAAPTTTRGSSVVDGVVEALLLAEPSAGVVVSGRDTVVDADAVGHVDDVAVCRDGAVRRREWTLIARGHVPAGSQRGMIARSSPLLANLSFIILMLKEFLACSASRRLDRQLEASGSGDDQQV